MQSIAGGITMIFMGVTVGFFGIFLSILLLQTPQRVITHDGNRLYITDFTCYAFELNEITFTTPSKESYGTLYLRVGERSFRFRFVADVSAVCDTLKALKSRSRKDRRMDEDQK